MKLEELKMNKEFLEKVAECLSNMIDYVDDGVISRGNPDFKTFFDDIDEAKEILNKLYIKLEEE